MEEIREDLLRAGLNKWRIKDYVGTLEYATGTGKTWAAIRAIKRLISINPDCHVLVIVPRNGLKANWIKEFKKFKLNYKKNVTLQCINSVYQAAGNYYDFVIADEIHCYLGNKYQQVFAGVKRKWLLGLSAFIPKNKIPYLNKIAPIVDSISLNKAQELGIVSDFVVIDYIINLSELDQIKYDDLSKKIVDYKLKFLKDNYSLISQRKALVSTNGEKLKNLFQILELLEDYYGIIFVPTIVEGHKIHMAMLDTSVIYSSAQSTEEKARALKILQDGRTKVKKIISPKSLNFGHNIKRVSWGIILSGDSSESDQIQQLGRVVRKGENGKLGIIIRLVMSKTIEYSWASKAQQSMKVKVVDNMEDLKALIHGN